MPEMPLLVRERYRECEVLLCGLRAAERDPELSIAPLRFEAKFVVFVALARSIPSLVKTSKAVIDQAIARLDPHDQALFRWFKRVRDKDLKKATKLLKTQSARMTPTEYAAWFSTIAPGPLLRGTVHVPNPAAFPPPADNDEPPQDDPLASTIRVNQLMIEVNGTDLRAVETCERYMRLLRQFLREPDPRTRAGS
jgi:hypothetical protein